MPDGVLHGPAPEDLSGPISVGHHIWWVGAPLPGDRFQCHPYLLEHGENSVLFDPGSELTFERTLEKIEQVTSFSNIRYFVCHHQDPDITGAMKFVESLVERDDARLITHGRAEAILKHLNVKIPFWRVEDHDWQLDLGDRELKFVFTPYLHFPGAFGTFDRATGIFFSSDLFGGFTDGTHLFARGMEDYAGVQLFHEHYMPGHDVLLHTLLKLDDLPIRIIAPQHGCIIPEPLVPVYISKLKSLDCGLYLLGEHEADITRLAALNNLLRDTAQALVSEPDFPSIAARLLELSQKLLPAVGLEFAVRADDDTALFLTPENRFRGQFAPLGGELRRALGTPRERWSELLKHDQKVDLGQGPGGHVLTLPLFSSLDETVLGLVRFRLTESFEPGSDLAGVLTRIGTPLGVAVERELLLRQLERERDEIYDRSIRDPLTGLYTRRYMDDAAGRLVKLHARDGRAPFALVMFDIDHFKRVNDDFGHPMGDQVLRGVAQTLQKLSREPDIPVRYGGEEFSLFLPLHELEGARSAADRLRRAVEGLEFKTPAGPISVTVSAGVASHRSAESLEALIARADRALYDAKQTGRNRVCTANN